VTTRMSARRQSTRSARSCGPRTGQWLVSDWRWEPHPHNLLDDLPSEARKELDHLARELTVRDSMVYMDGSDYTGRGPGLRTETRGSLMVTYLTDVRGERIVVLQVTWFA
jgi:hypothetical protein